jgi:hypothetical protein
MHPANVLGTCPNGAARALGQHLGVGVQADHLVEAVS